MSQPSPSAHGTLNPRTMQPYAACAPTPSAMQDAAETGKQIRLQRLADTVIELINAGDVPPTCKILIAANGGHVKRPRIEQEL
jgi:hypothetical protein